MGSLKFTKMNGAGNDFVLVDNRSGNFKLESEQIRRWCDRHRGIGADGLLMVEKGVEGADFQMRYYNADGHEAEMCGNGARCFARYAARLIGGERDKLSFQTMAGKVTAELIGDEVKLGMSEPHGLRLDQKLVVNGKELTVSFLNTGVPHAVVYLDDFSMVDVGKDGSALRHHEFFKPKGTNANFVTIQGPRKLKVRTYERGVEDETLACGTGVVAVALLHHVKTGAASPIEVEVQGGDVMTVAFVKSGETGFSEVTLTGPADFVFEGETSLL